LITQLRKFVDFKQKLHKFRKWCFFGKQQMEMQNRGSDLLIL